jgi:hypothetical protein
MKHVFVDNCSSHNGSKRVIQVLSLKNTKLCYLPPCTTHLCQPADTFVIKNQGCLEITMGKEEAGMDTMSNVAE